MTKVVTWPIGHWSRLKFVNIDNRPKHPTQTRSELTSVECELTTNNEKLKDNICSSWLEVNPPAGLECEQQWEPFIVNLPFTSVHVTKVIKIVGLLLLFLSHQIINVA